MSAIHAGPRARVAGKSEGGPVASTGAARRSWWSGLGQSRLDPADHEPHRGGDAVGADTLVLDRRHGAQRKQHPEEDAGGVPRVDVPADAPEPLLGGQVGGQGLGWAGRQRGTGSRHCLAALRRELGIGGDRQLEREDLVPQAGEPNGGVPVRFSSTVPSPARAGSVVTHATIGAFAARTVATKSEALSGKWR